MRQQRGCVRAWTVNDNDKWHASSACLQARNMPIMDHILDSIVPACRGRATQSLADMPAAESQYKAGVSQEKTASWHDDGNALCGPDVGPDQA